MIGVSDIAIKAMTNIASSSGVLDALLSPWLALAVTMAVVSFLTVSRAFQIGDAVPVITIIGVAASMIQIVGGIVIFEDPLPGNALGMVAQGVGFALICAAAMLVPAPTRAVSPQLA